MHKPAGERLMIRVWTFDIPSVQALTTSHKMGWLWGSSSDDANKLDPSLREFLKKEAPTGPKPTLPTAPPKEKPVEPSPTAVPPVQAPTQPEKPFVPPQSQFQDGRYAHLWKDYRPYNEMMDAGKNEQDKLRDLVDAYNGRSATVGQIAMENCAIEYLD